ncbi:MAG: hypothetical protein AAGI30_11090 [Planctomycetota bacterium]
MTSATSAGAMLAALATVASCAAVTTSPERPVCRAELRSWVVALRGRHLYLDLRCAEPFAHLSGRVEYTEARLRQGWVPQPGQTASGPLIRMSRSAHLRPPPSIGTEDNRFEAEYRLTLAQARCLQADRLYTEPYRLVGTNSTSALRAAMETCGCALPEHVVASGGLLGEFPGVWADAGPEVSSQEWALYGFPGGPTPIPSRSSASRSPRRRSMVKCFTRRPGPTIQRVNTTCRQDRRNHPLWAGRSK